MPAVPRHLIWYDQLRRSRAAAVVRQGVHRVIIAWAGLRQTWRRSLQLRMVVITVVASGLLVTVFGTVLASMITEGLVRSKVDSARVQLNSTSVTVSQQLSVVTDKDDPALLPTLAQLVQRAKDQQPDSGFYVAIVPSATDALPVGAQVLPAVDLRKIVPADLRQTVGTQHRVAHEFTTLNPDGAGERPYLVLGEPIQVTLGQFEVYYVFPLAAEEAAADLVRNTVVATGALLVLCMAALAALTTRMMVRPVRQAARTAQRFSLGLFDQRMSVHGEDDLALLGSAFNQMAENLQRQIVRLEEMSRLQRRFTSDVSHELRTPLTTVRMAADLIFAERSDFDPAVARSAELLQAELDRFEELLSDLLEISRFDAGFAVLDGEPTDLTVMVSRVVDRLTPLATRAGVGLELSLPTGAVIADVDPRRVERVLRNLVGNAVEHAEGRPVAVTLRCDESAAAVAVRDHGIGLQPGEEKLVFNRFWRADPSRARQTGGTGLGLSISLEDARLHGGWLEAWGAPGQGAQFRLTLPLRAGDRLVSSPVRLVPLDASVKGIAIDASRPGLRPASRADPTDQAPERGRVVPFERGGAPPVIDPVGAAPPDPATRRVLTADDAVPAPSAGGADAPA